MPGRLAQRAANVGFRCTPVRRRCEVCTHKTLLTQSRHHSLSPWRRRAYFSVKGFLGDRPAGAARQAVRIMSMKARSAAGTCLWP